MTKSLVLLAAAAVPLLALPTAARAELPERRSPLADSPAVRQRAELRSLRFEIGPAAATTIGQDYYHAVLVGGRATFFLADWLAVGGFFGFNLTKDFKTSFHERLEGVLPKTEEEKAMKMDQRAPLLSEAKNGMNHIAWAAAAQVELIPFSGKYSLFGKIFAAYDFYGFGGPGFINFEGGGPCDANLTDLIDRSCPVTGLKIGANFGVGVRTYFSQYFSMNLEARDILLRNNPSGRDESGDRAADKEDYSWDSNYMVTLSLTFFLPPTARISD
jgi:outer membrane beta-barrel protein